LFDEGINIGNWLRGGEFEMFNATDKRTMLVDEFRKHVKPKLKVK
jgi:hypothetical protein